MACTHLVIKEVNQLGTLKMITSSVSYLKHMFMEEYCINIMLEHVVVVS